MIEVKGVRFPAYMDQIDFPYFKMFSEKRIVEKKKIFIDNVRQEKGNLKIKVDNGVFLALMPVFDKDVFDDADYSNYDRCNDNEENLISS
jgi:hypothetical protein